MMYYHFKIFVDYLFKFMSKCFVSVLMRNSIGLFFLVYFWQVVLLTL